MKIQTQSLLLLGLTVSLFAGKTAHAGSLVDLVCTNKACNYKGRVSLGGALMFDQITGYCTHDREFVYLRWERDEDDPTPIKVWNPQTGQLMELYSCPKCTEPFFPIKKLDDLKFCPKCNKATLQVSVVGVYD